MRGWLKGRTFPWTWFRSWPGTLTPMCGTRWREGKLAVRSIFVQTCAGPFPDVQLKRLDTGSECFGRPHTGLLCSLRIYSNVTGNNHIHIWREYSGKHKQKTWEAKFRGLTDPLLEGAVQIMLPLVTGAAAIIAVGMALSSLRGRGCTRRIPKPPWINAFFQKRRGG